MTFIKIVLHQQASFSYFYVFITSMAKMPLGASATRYGSDFNKRQINRVPNRNTETRGLGKKFFEHVMIYWREYPPYKSD